MRVGWRCLGEMDKRQQERREGDCICLCPHILPAAARGPCRPGPVLCLQLDALPARSWTPAHLLALSLAPLSPWTTPSVPSLHLTPWNSTVHPGRPQGGARALPCRPPPRRGHCGHFPTTLERPLTVSGRSQEAQVQGSKGPQTPCPQPTRGQRPGPPAPAPASGPALGGLAAALTPSSFQGSYCCSPSNEVTRQDANIQLSLILDKPQVTS